MPTLYGYATLRAETPSWRQRLAHAFTPLEWTVVIALVAVVAGLIYAGVRDARQWRAFMAEHNCRLLQVVAPRASVGTGTTITGSGQVGITTVVIPTARRHVYQCDDGVTYVR